jgi:hypothetical protein
VQSHGAQRLTPSRLFPVIPRCFQSWRRRLGTNPGQVHQTLTPDGIGQGGKQGLVVYGFAEVGDRTAVQGTLAALFGVLSGDDQDRQGIVRLCEALLNFEAVHVRHVQVQYYAGGPLARQRVEELCARGECCNVETGGAEQSLERPANWLFVVHNRNEVARDTQRVTAVGNAPIRSTSAERRLAELAAALVHKLRQFTYTWGF